MNLHSFCIRNKCKIRVDCAIRDALHTIQVTECRFKFVDDVKRFHSNVALHVGWPYVVYKGSWSTISFTFYFDLFHGLSSISR